MMEIDPEFVRAVDDQLISEGVGLHARPFHVVLKWMRSNNITGDILDKRIWDPLMRIYRTMYPDGDFSIPGMMTGGVAIRDRMYPVRINLIFGQFKINPRDAIKITNEELDFIWKNYPEQFWRAFYGVCDLYDIGYGSDDIIQNKSPAGEMIANARSSVSAIARILSSDVDLDAAVQASCLAAELSLKAALRHLGVGDEKLFSLSHNLPKASRELVKIKPKYTDARLVAACGKFPNYTKTRYASHGLTRVELMHLAMRAQFVAADAIRRISDRDMASEFEGRPDCPARPDP